MCRSGCVARGPCTGTDNGVVWLWEWRLCGRSLRRQRSFPWPTSLRLVALGGCWCRSTRGSTFAERPEQVRRRRPQDERQGEDLPFNQQGERTPFSNHPPLSPTAVAIHHAYMRPLEPSRCHSGLKWGQACVTPSLTTTHCSACAHRLSLECWRPSSRGTTTPPTEGAGARAATAAQGDWQASRPVRRPCVLVSTRLAFASLVCSLEAPYGEPPAYFCIYSRV